MKINNFIKMAFNNLKKRRLRTILNSIAIAIGTSLLVVMLGLGVGTQSYVWEEIKKYDLFNEILVSSEEESKTSVSFNISVGEESKKENIKEEKKVENKITKEIVEKFKKIEGVELVRPVILTNVNEIKIKEDVNISGVTVIGYDPNFDALWYKGNGRVSPILEGRELTKEDKNEILIGEKLLKSMGIKDYKDLVNKDVELVVNNPIYKTEIREKVKIVGIVKENTGYSDGIVVPIDLAVKFKEFQFGEKNYLEKYGYDLVYVRAKSFKESEKIVKEIRKLGFSASTFEEALKELEKYFNIFKAILGGFGVIVLITASIGVMNTMIMAVYERTKFVGLLRAIGASKKDIRNIFLVEAGTIGFLGGVLGVIIGLLLNQAINLFINYMLIKDSSKFVNIFSAPPSLVIGIMVFTVLLSAFSGLYPAIRASKLDPVEALRYE